MHEPTEGDRQRQRADELRSQIKDLKHGDHDPSHTESPREFTNTAANEAAHRDDAARDEQDDSVGRP